MQIGEVNKMMGKNIKKISEVEAANNTEFAESIDISLTQLMNVIKGNRGFSPKKLIEIHNKTGYSLDYIMMGKTVHIEETIKEDIKKAYEHIKEAEKILNRISLISS